MSWEQHNKLLNLVKLSPLAFQTQCVVSVFLGQFKKRKKKKKADCLIPKHGVRWIGADRDLY